MLRDFFVWARSCPCKHAVADKFARDSHLTHLPSFVFRLVSFVYLKTYLYVHD